MNGDGGIGRPRRRSSDTRPAWAALLLTGAVLVSAADPTPADEGPNINARVNYVYAAQFGFGAYEVGGMSVNVYTLPIAFSFANIYRDWTLRLALPVTYGHYFFRTHIEGPNDDVTVEAQTHSLATEPRIQIDIPVFEGLRVSPLGAWGAGSTIDSTGSVKENGKKTPINTAESFFYTYQFGYTALYEHDWLPFRAFYGNALIWAGDEFFDAANDVESYGTLRNGIEVRHPLGFTIYDRVPDGGLYFIYDHFFPSLEFTRVHEATLEVSDLFEVGLDVGAASPLNLPWIGAMLDDVRLGVGYQAGDGLNAVKVSTGFPF